MKTTTKELIQEIIDYLPGAKSSRTFNYLSNADQVMGGYSELGPYLRDIKMWMDPFYDSILETNIDELQLIEEGYDNGYIYNKYIQIFEYIPEIADLLSLNEETITYNSELSQSEIDEIRTYFLEQTKRRGE